MITEEDIQKGIENYSEEGKRKLSPENLRRFVVRDLEHFEEMTPYRELAKEIGENFTGIEVRENIFSDNEFAIVVMKEKVRMYLSKWAKGIIHKLFKHVNLPDLVTLQVNKEEKESRFLLLTNVCKSDTFKQDAEAIYRDFPLKYPSNDGAQGIVLFLNRTDGTH